MYDFQSIMTRNTAATKSFKKSNQLKVDATKVDKVDKVNTVLYTI